MLLLSNAFTAVSLILFFYSVLFVSDAFSPQRSVGSSSGENRSLVTLIAIDAFAVYAIVTGQTTTGLDIDPTVTMVTAAFGNALFAFS